MPPAPDITALLRRLCEIAGLPVPDESATELRLRVGRFDIDVVALAAHRPATLQLRIDVGRLDADHDPRLYRELLQLNLFGAQEAWGVLAFDDEMGRLLMLRDVVIDPHELPEHALLHALRHAIGQAEYVRGLLAHEPGHMHAPMPPMPA